MVSKEERREQRLQKLKSIARITLAENHKDWQKKVADEARRHFRVREGTAKDYAWIVTDELRREGFTPLKPINIAKLIKLVQQRPAFNDVSVIKFNKN